MPEGSELSGKKDSMGWPMPGSPEWDELSEQTQRMVEQCQPEAIFEIVHFATRAAFEAVIRLSEVPRAFTDRVFENALQELPPERAASLKEQLDFMREFGSKESAAGENALFRQLASLSINGTRAKNFLTTEQTTKIKA